MELKKIFKGGQGLELLQTVFENLEQRASDKFYWFL